MKLLLALLYASGALAATPRAISLSPAITEIVFALGLEKTLVGVSEYSDFPEAAKKIPNVGPYSKPDAEKIISLNPTVILLPAEGPEDIARRLKELNTSIEVIEIKTLDNVGQAAIRIAQALGKISAGQNYKKNWNKDISKIFGKQKKLNRPAVATVVQSEPLMIAANHTFLNEVVSRCGGKNIYEHLSGYPRVSSESLVVRKPQIILLVEHSTDLPAWEKKLKRLNLEKATTKVIPPDIATRPGPRLLKGIEMICQIIKNSGA